MAILITWAKIYSVAKYFCTARVGGLDEIFVQRKFSAVLFNVHVLLCNEERIKLIAQLAAVGDFSQ